MRRDSFRKCVILCVTVLFLSVMLGGCHRASGEIEEFTVKESESELSEDTDDENLLEDEDANETNQEASEPSVIYVDVRGQVNVPGVYELTAESRVFEAIERAGGLTKKAAETAINQAEKLSDGQQIYVPSRKEVKEKSTASDTAWPNEEGTDDSEAALNGTKKVNLNTASKEELMSLTGIGEAKAEAIIQYRSEQGGFQSIEDIMKIDGIKDGVFNKVKDQITV